MLLIRVFQIFLILFSYFFPHVFHFSPSMSVPLEQDLLGLWVWTWRCSWVKMGYGTGQFHPKSGFGMENIWGFTKKIWVPPTGIGFLSLWSWCLEPKGGKRDDLRNKGWGFNFKLRGLTKNNGGWKMRLCQTEWFFSPKGEWRWRWAALWVIAQYQGFDQYGHVKGDFTVGHGNVLQFHLIWGNIFHSKNRGLEANSFDSDFCKQ